MSDLTAAIQNVATLKQLRLPDDQPHIEAAAATVNYEVDFDTNFQDREAFVAGVSKYVEEAQSLADLVCLSQVSMPRTNTYPYGLTEYVFGARR